ncbi:MULTISPECIES: radical SAM family heme chaperone HemW [unclassified Okeania]|uniref:radical SAM family heme chaperone HemW n=1 Tax=unclassified Okeania TaxID=2634635 RepID=UPI0013B89138|nr:MULTISPECIES: radical SAM family heme chaperone HemW [unclassified Okeania]NES79438.1 coproporphyrinogen III oxidase [Okeania sp. SIO1H4]NET15074.1 coproporphyrinogen III oxidase [Okeania sp. SIO1H6]NET23598.1 coproporphyrinogen III oxidase [Okeania sp. SIO1H5]NET93293.1 coproporphyrinogen III oxidase [Okeania sp. SIO1H2]
MKRPIGNYYIPSSAYVHIPFCRRRCYYCDFPISVVGDNKRGDNFSPIQEYVEVICEEINITKSFDRPLETIFFGGGTPSLLSVSQLNRILDALEQKFRIVANAEISIEMDPGTFDLEQVRGYKFLGINRVSLGVQAFQDELLNVCGRTHNVSDIYKAVDILHQAGIVNFSIDLISGLPHQTLEQWQTSLEAGIAISPTHISSYDLVVEAVTAFGRYYQPGNPPLPTDETTAQMYRMAQQLISISGYEHYEISNYAKPNYQCGHNRVYWENLPYYGFGMGAASYVAGERFTRPPTRKEYYQWVQSVDRQYKLSLQDRSFKHQGIDTSNNCLEANQECLLETLMLGFRLADGINLSTLSQRFGQQTVDQILIYLQPYQKLGWVELINPKGIVTLFSNNQKFPVEGYLRLTDPEGFLFSNTVLSTLFSKLSNSISMEY